MVLFVSTKYRGYYSYSQQSNIQLQQYSHDDLTSVVSSSASSLMSFDCNFLVLIDRLECALCMSGVLLMTKTDHMSWLLFCYLTSVL